MTTTTTKPKPILENNGEPLWGAETLMSRTMNQHYRLKSSEMRRHPETDGLIFRCQLRTYKHGDETFLILSRDIKEFLEGKFYKDPLHGVGAGKVFGTGINSNGADPDCRDPLIPCEHANMYEDNYNCALDYMKTNEDKTVRVMSAERQYFCVILKAVGKDTVTMVLTSDLLLSLMKRMGAEHIHSIKDLAHLESYSFASSKKEKEKEEFPLWTLQDLKSRGGLNHHRIRTSHLQRWRPFDELDRLLCQLRTREHGDETFWIKKECIEKYFKWKGWNHGIDGLKKGRVFGSGICEHGSDPDPLDPLVPFKSRPIYEKNYIDAIRNLDANKFTKMKRVWFDDGIYVVAFGNEGGYLCEKRLTPDLLLSLLKRYGACIKTIDHLDYFAFYTVKTEKEKKDSEEEETVPIINALVKRLLKEPAPLSEKDVETFEEKIKATSPDIAKVIIEGLITEENDDKVKTIVKEIIGDEILLFCDIIYKTLKETLNKADGKFHASDMEKYILSGMILNNASKIMYEDTEKFEEVINVLKGVDPGKKEEEGKNKIERWFFEKLKRKMDRSTTFRIAVGEVRNITPFSSGCTCHLKLESGKQYKFAVSLNALEMALKPYFCIRDIEKKLFVWDEDAIGYYSGFDYDPLKWDEPIMPKDYNPLEDEYLRACEFIDNAKDGDVTMKVNGGVIPTIYEKKFKKYKIVTLTRYGGKEGIGMINCGKNTVHVQLEMHRIIDVLEKIGHANISHEDYQLTFKQVPKKATAI